MASLQNLVCQIYEEMLSRCLDARNGAPIPDYADFSRQLRLSATIATNSRRSRRSSSRVSDTIDSSSGSSERNFRDLFPVFKFSGPNKSQCVVCYADFKYGQNVKALPCLHKFHVHCIDPWLKKEHKCPVCRYDFTKVVDIKEL